jgi:hypothetical protein
VLLLAVFGSSLAIALAWIQVTRDRYGSASVIADMECRLAKTEKDLAAISAIDLKRVQDEISALKAKGVWKA